MIHVGIFFNRTWFFDVWMVIRMMEQRVVTHHSVRLLRAFLLGH